MENPESRHLIAEFEEHEATWIAWPHNRYDWPGKFAAIKWVYAEIVRILSQSEKVNIIVQSKEHQTNAEKLLFKSNVEQSNLKFFIKKTNRGWLRDIAPSFISVNNSLSAVGFNFNGWAKYNDYQLDNRISKFIAHKAGINYQDVIYNKKKVSLEGGAIDTNGKGTLITTEECLLDDKIQVRNPAFDKKDYAKVFGEYLGVSNIIWLGKGITGDDTHGHVDDLCRFVNDDTVVIAVEEKSSDENYKALQENKERLKDAKVENGKSLNYIELPIPSPVIFKGQRLPASYANFYISNYYVLVPTFNDLNDRIALGILSELFPDRKVIGIHSIDLVWGLGTIHCLTHEQPRINL